MMTEKARQDTHKHQIMSTTSEWFGPPRHIFQGLSHYYTTKPLLIALHMVQIVRFGTWKGKRKKGRYFEHIPLKIVITRAVYSPLEDYFAK